MPTSQKFSSNLLHTRPNTNSRVVLVALIVFCCIFVIGYASRLAKKAELEAEAAHWGERIDQAKQQSLALAAERDYVASNAYIEKKARDELGMAQQGDTLVIVVSSTPTPWVRSQSEAAPEVKNLEIANWQQWLMLFLPQTAPKP